MSRFFFFWTREASGAVFTLWMFTLQERLQKERWAAEQEREAEPEPEREPEPVRAPPAPARQLPPEPESEPEESPYDDGYGQADEDNPYEETESTSPPGWPRKFFNYLSIVNLCSKITGGRVQFL
jgi:hypothetical protein